MLMMTHSTPHLQGCTYCAGGYEIGLIKQALKGGRKGGLHHHLLLFRSVPMLFRLRAPVRSASVTGYNPYLEFAQKTLHNCAYQHRRTDVPLIINTNPVVFYTDTSV